jgi:hypothetical protein
MIYGAPIPAAFGLVASLTSPDMTIVALFFAVGHPPADKTTAEKTPALARPVERP